MSWAEVYSEAYQTSIFAKRFIGFIMIFEYTDFF